MSLADVQQAAARLAEEINRKVDVIDQKNGWVAVIIRDEPTPPEKSWRATVDLIANVNVDFPRLGFENTGVYVLPQDCWGTGTPPKSGSYSNTQLPNVGACTRFSWSPKDLPQGSDLRPFYMWMRARLYVKET